MKTICQVTLFVLAALLWGGALLCATPALAQSTGADNCTNATPISGTGLFNFDNQNVGPYEPDYGNCGMSKDVWFRWTAPAAGQVIFTTCGLADSDTVIAVYAGASCAGAAISCNDNSGCGVQSTVTFNAVAGGVYTLQIGSFWASAVGWYGRFSLTFPPPPTTYDSCAAAQSIAGTGVFSFDTTTATSTAADPAACAAMGRDVWFNWTPTGSGRAYVTTCGQGVAFDTVLAAYTNTCDLTAQPLACNNDDTCTGNSSTINFIVTAGQTYKLRVGSPNGTQGGPGHFAISLIPSITNDECSTATTVSGTGVFSFNNATATDSDVGHIACGQPGKDVWFRWTAPGAGQTTITSCGLISDMNTVMVLYADQCPVALPLACNDDSACGVQSRIDFMAQAGTSYLLRIGSSLGYSFTTAGQFSIAQAPPGGGGETITVNTLNDVSDFTGFQQVSDLPGTDGRISFREAVTAANNTPGPQTIAFAISPAEFWLVSGVGLLRLEQDAFFLNDSGTTIDFSTQTVNMGDTNPNGPEIGIYGLQPNGWGSAAIFVNGDNCVVKGLGKVYQRGYAVQIVGDNNRVIGCQIDGPLHAAVIVNGYLGGPTPSGNIVGGTAPGEGNILTGLRIDGPAEGNIVIGNTLLIGVEVRGATQYGVIARDNRIGGPTAAERNVISGAGSYGEEGFPDGEQVSIVDADGTIVEGNYIGTTADGMARYPQIGPVGVEVRDSRGTTIRGNLIAGLRTVGTNHYAGQIFGQAVYVGATNANTQDTVIQGNTIGLAADGTTPIVTRSGVTVSPITSFYHAFGTLIASNEIASVETTGVFVASLENGVTITGNSIHDCGGLGIDLISSSGGGVTPNDPGDGDTGGNGLQNFPVLLSATTTGSAVIVQGTLDSSASEQFTVEFFVSPSCDPSGFGEGATFIGSTLVTTDGAGHAAFTLTLPAAAAAGATATATATRLSTGDTSEFSACLAVTSAATPIPTPVATPVATPTPIATATPIATTTPAATATPIATATPMAVAGTISYCSAASSPDPVPNVTLTLTGTMGGSTSSDLSGDYTLSSLPSGGNYVVTPTKAALTPASADIDTVDAIAIQRHFLVLGTPLAGCRLTAADVDLNTSVNSVDVVAVQRFFLGLTTGIGNVGQYQFTPVNRAYLGLVSNQTGQNYDALVFGDVASNFVERVDGPSQDALGDDMSVSTLSGLNTSAGEVPDTVAAVALPEVAVDQSKSNFIAAVRTPAIDAKNRLVGFQGDFTFDERVITFQSQPVQKAGLTGGNWNVSGNVLAGNGPIRTLRISAYSNDFTPLSGSGTLFELRMTRARQAAQSTALLWAAPPDQFTFIDADLNTQKPGDAVSGEVTPLRKRK